MELDVGLAVLAAAALHAGWNAVVKVSADRLAAITLVTGGAGLVALALLPFVAVPPGPAWPFLLLSVALHLGYNCFLVLAYGRGDLGHVYPIARGTAPLLVMLAGSAVAGEHLAPGTALAVLLLTSGIVSLALRGGRGTLAHDPRPVLYALATAAFIAAYTVTDGLGARRAGDPHAYALWLFALDGLPMPFVLLLRRRWFPGPASPVAFAEMVPPRRQLVAGLLGGAMSLAAYWIVIWALTRAPMAPVAALRETSVLFAALLSALVLKEGFGRWRIASAVLVAAGVALLRL